MASRLGLPKLLVTVFLLSLLLHNPKSHTVEAGGLYDYLKSCLGYPTQSCPPPETQDTGAAAISPREDQRKEIFTDQVFEGVRPDKHFIGSEIHDIPAGGKAVFVSSRKTGKKYLVKVKQCQTDADTEKVKQEYEIGQLLNTKQGLARTVAFYRYENEKRDKATCTIVLKRKEGWSVGSLTKKPELVRNGRLRLWKAMGQLASGVDAMCSKGVTHGYLPQDVTFQLSEARDRAVINDLGLAEKTGVVSQVAKPCAVRSPESFFEVQASGCGVDVFGLCNIFTSIVGNPVIEDKQEGVCEPKILSKYAKLYKGTIHNWVQASEMPFLPEEQITNNFMAHYKLDEDEALLLKDMCHWDTKKRVTPESLVGRIDNFVKRLASQNRRAKLSRRHSIG